jgi:hypothetical protein
VFLYSGNRAGAHSTPSCFVTMRTVFRRPVRWRSGTPLSLRPRHCVPWLLRPQVAWASNDFAKQNYDQPLAPHGLTALRAS